MITSELVVLSAVIFTSPLNSSAVAAPAGAEPGGGAGGTKPRRPGAAPAGRAPRPAHALRQRLERGGHVLGLRVLEVVDVDAAAAGGDVELADQLQHAAERA